MSTEGETAAITPELYNAIVTIVDGRMKEFQVSREDFSELRAIVTELAEAQTKTEEALKELATQMGKLSDNIGFSLEDVILVASYQR